MRLKLSENIKKFRKERKMTQEQLAEAMGVSASAVYKWESNQSTPEIADMKFFTTLGIERQPTYPDRYGKTAMDCLLRRIPPDDNTIPGLRRLWLEVTKEVLPNETV